MPTEQTDTTQTPPEEISYTPTVWADGEDGGTPINAANLNNIEDAIVALVERTTKQVVTSMIADGAVTKDKLEKTLGDSLSRFMPITSQHDAIYWWLDKDGERLCLYSDQSGLYNKLIGIIRFSK